MSLVNTNVVLDAYIASSEPATVSLAGKMVFQRAPKSLDLDLSSGKTTIQHRYEQKHKIDTKVLRLRA